MCGCQSASFHLFHYNQFVQTISRKPNKYSLSFYHETDAYHSVELYSHSASLWLQIHLVNKTIHSTARLWKAQWNREKSKKRKAHHLYMYLILVIVLIIPGNDVLLYSRYFSLGNLLYHKRILRVNFIMAGFCLLTFTKKAIGSLFLRYPQYEPSTVYNLSFRLQC